MGPDDRQTPEELKAELAAFNHFREGLLGGQLLYPGERIPLGFSGVGGDVGPEEIKREAR